MLGLNIPRDGSVTVEQLKSILPHGGWARLVLTGWHENQEYIRTLQAGDFRVVGVVASESFQSISLPADNPEAAAAYYASRYDGLVTAVQVGNEWDHRSESSETLDLDALNRRLAAFAAEFHISPLILGGAVSGDPTRLRGVRLDLVSACAIHPYGQRPEPAWPSPDWGFGFYSNLLSAYAAELSGLGQPRMPLWVTEVGLSTDEVPEAFRAEYLGRFCRSWEATRRTPLILFSAHHYAGFGLLDTPSGEAVRRVATSSPQPAPEPIPLPTPIPIPPLEVPTMLPEKVRLAIWRAHISTAAFNPAFGIEKAWSEDPYGFGPALTEGEITGPDGMNYRPFAYRTIRWHPSKGAEIIGAKAA